MKKKTKRKPIGGPYLAAAVFCDNVVRGEDGAMSAIRIVDRLNVAVPADAPPDVPSESHRIAVTIWTLIMFKTGDGKGKHTVSLVVQSPSGKRTKGPKHELNFSAEPQGGANLRIQVGLGIKEGGLFFIDVFLDGKRATRMPLLISVTRGELEKPPVRKPTKQLKKFVS